MAAETEKAAAALRGRIAALEGAMTKGKTEKEELQAVIAKVRSERDAANAAAARSDARARQLAEQLVVERTAAEERQKADAQALEAASCELGAANTELSVLRRRERARIQRAMSQRGGAAGSGGSGMGTGDDASVSGDNGGGPGEDGVERAVPGDGAAPSPVKAKAASLDIKAAAETWFDTAAVQ